MIESEYKTLDEFLQNFYASNPFTTDLGLRLGDISDGVARAELDLAKRHTNVYSIAHGGVLLTMADMIMGAACILAGAKVVTLNLNNNFIKASRLGDTLKAEGHVLHAGKTTLVAEGKIYNQKGELCASCTGTFIRIGNIELNG